MGRAVVSVVFGSAWPGGSASDPPRHHELHFYGFYGGLGRVAGLASPHDTTRFTSVVFTLGGMASLDLYGEVFTLPLPPPPKKGRTKAPNILCVRPSHRPPSHPNVNRLVLSGWVRGPPLPPSHTNKRQRPRQSQATNTIRVVAETKARPSHKYQGQEKHAGQKQHRDWGQARPHIPSPFQMVQIPRRAKA